MVGLCDGDIIASIPPLTELYTKRARLAALYLTT